jgi:D-3-phosphoglycerate dehydrogenase / 2-oxoglutarate reductase
MHLSTSSWRVWTDVALRPEAEEQLVRAGATLIRTAPGSLEGVATADAMIIGSRLTADETLFAEAVRLKVLARVGIGYDRVDLDAATRVGVCVVNTPDAPTESTAEFAITLMLAVARRLTIGANAVSAGDWVEDGRILGFDLAGKTLGLVGCGRIGRRVGEIARALRMTVVGFDPFVAPWPDPVRRMPSLPALLECSDVVSLHVPATPENVQLFGTREMQQCRPGAILINTARGPLIDESALGAALESGQIGGAGIDVWDPEPPPPDHPLRRHPRVIATPHMAAFTAEGKQRSHDAAAQQVLQVLRGERPASFLNPAVWAQRRGRT